MDTPPSNEANQTVRMSDNNNHNTMSTSPGSTVRMVDPSSASTSSTVRMDASHPERAGDRSFDIIRAEKLSGTPIELNGTTYFIDRVISDRTGEADIFLVSNNGKKFVYKKYKNNIVPKKDVLAVVKAIDHPNVIRLIDFGSHSDGFFELMEYAEGGTIDRHAPFRELPKLKSVIGQCVEALHYCHERSLLHRDIKPENIFCSDDSCTRIMIADFGIASMVDQNAERKMTNRNLTISYAAPETMGLLDKVIIGRETDYFSLGLTIIYLWKGSDPFGENANLHQVVHQITTANIEIPDDMPKDLAHLVRGLITHNYLDRWGYEEVSRWLKGEHVDVVAYQAMDEKALPPFDFIEDGGQMVVARNKVEMAKLLWRYRDHGTKLLFRGMVSRWIEVSERFAANSISDTIEKYEDNKELALIRSILILDPNFGFIDHANKLYPLKGDTDEKLHHLANLIEYELGVLGRLTMEIVNKSLERLETWLEIQSIPLVAELSNIHGAETGFARLNGLLQLMHMQKDGASDYSFTYRGSRFENLMDLRSAEDDSKFFLVQDLYMPGSRFLCWLTYIGFLSSVKSIEEAETAELVELIHEMPWLKDKDTKLSARLNRLDNANMTDLMRVAAEGDLRSVTRLVDNGAAVNQKNSQGLTAFAYAARSTSLDVMKFLQERSATINPVYKEGDHDSPLLHELCSTGKFASVEFLLSKGVDPNQVRAWDSFTPLLCAIRVGDEALVNLLLEKGAKVSSASSSTSVLHEAAKSGNLELFKKLFAFNDDVNYSIGRGYSILMAAAEVPQASSIVQYLIDYPKTPGTRKQELKVNAGTKNIISKKYSEGNVPVSPALAYAVWNYSEESVRLLIEAGAQTNITYNEWSLLMWIASQPHKSQIPIMQHLIAGKVNINYTTGTRENALHKALYHYDDGRKAQPEVVRLLLKAGCNPYQNYHRPDIEARMNPFTVAAGFSSKEIISTFIECGVSVSRAREEGSGINPIYRAVLQKNHGTLEILARHRKGINAYSRQKIGTRWLWPSQTPLLLAVQENDGRAVDLLVENGADISQLDRNGRNARDLARLGGNSKIISRVQSAVLAPPLVNKTVKVVLQGALLIVLGWFLVRLIIGAYLGGYPFPLFSIPVLSTIVPTLFFVSGFMFLLVRLYYQGILQKKSPLRLIPYFLSGMVAQAIVFGMFTNSFIRETLLGNELFTKTVGIPWTLAELIWMLGILLVLAPGLRILVRKFSKMA